MAKLNGLPTPTAIWLISAIGVANTIGRVGCGVVSSIPGTDVILMNNVALTIGGIMTMFATLSANPIFLFTYCAIFGLSIGKAVRCFYLPFPKTIFTSEDGQSVASKTV